MRSKLIVLFILFTFISIQAQNAKELFDKKEYAAAALAYEKSVQSAPADYLNLAKCYIATQQFESAVESLKNYTVKYSGADKTYANALIAILERDDDMVKIENIGGNINSANSEIFPRISQDGKKLYFISSDRAGGYGGDDAWYSTRNDDGSWNKPTVLSSQVNTDSHEGILAISGDGNVAIFFGNYQGSFGSGDLFYSVRQGASEWSFPCNLGGTINSDSWESMANLGPDGRTMFFTSDRSGGQGEEDIWVSTLSETGWSAPVNLGPVINSTDDEKYPFLSADGKTLYFSSSGHPGFGGQDLFVSRRLGDGWTEWSTPVNLGKYINTLENDQDLSIPASGVRGYMVKYNQPGGLGSADIYTFVLPMEMRPEPVFSVYGTVQDDHGNPVAAIIRYQDIDSGEEIATATSNKEDGMYRVALPAYRRYAITIDMKGYLYYSDLLDLRNPDELVEKQTINQILATEVSNIETARKNFQEYNMKLESLLKSSSNDISTMFSEYQGLANKYQNNSRILETYIKRAKMEWLSNEDDTREFRKDYVLQPIKIGAKLELKNIYFDFAKATLRSESRQALDQVYDLLERAPITVEISGHTDNVGSDDANLSLSQARVDEVKKFLVQKGITENRIAAVGYGEKYPIATNDTDEGRQKNRRVELKITNITQREGSDVVKDEIKYDMLTLLYSAAKAGGIPEDSPCLEGDGIVKTDVVKPAPVVTKTKPVTQVDEITLDTNILGGFSASILNFGLDNTDDALGVSLIYTSEDLDETHLEYYFSTPTGMDWLAGAGYIMTVQFNDIFNINLNWLMGVESKFWSVKVLNEDKVQYYINLPIGFRYIHKISDFTLGYDAIYDIGLTASDDPAEIKPSYLRLGANARYGMFQGALHLNSGDDINYFGFRLGVTF